MKYYLQNGIQQTGPFTLEELAIIADKDIFYVWYEGESNWKPLTSLFEDNIRPSKVVNNGLDMSLPEPKRNFTNLNKGAQRPFSYRFLSLVLTFFLVIVSSILVSLFLKNSDLNEQLSFIDEEKKILDTRLNKISSSYYPIVVNSLKFKNGYNDNFEYGSIFQATNSKYVYPIISFQKTYPPYYKNRITYIDTSAIIKIGIKILDSNGKLQRPAERPSSKYTYDFKLKLQDIQSNDLNVSIEETLEGWGNYKSPSYNLGIYQVQIWYENKCLYEDSFKII